MKTRLLFAALFLMLIFNCDRLMAQPVLFPTQMFEAPALTQTTTEIQIDESIRFCKFTPKASGEIQMGTSSSDGSDTYGYLYNSEGVMIAVNDDYTDLDFKIVMYLEAGQTYYLGIAEITGLTGTVFLNVSSEALPVELTSFSALVKGRDVSLSWKTATEVNNYGFEVERAKACTEKSAFEKIAFIEGSGSSNSEKSYSYTDKSVEVGEYTYRLKQLDIDGKFKYSDEVNVSLKTPAEYRLMQNSPNPFNPSTTIRFELPAASHVVLRVYDIVGREVATLLNEEQSEGRHEAIWNGKDSHGLSVASGVYIYRLTAGSFVQTRKMNLMK